MDPAVKTTSIRCDLHPPLSAIMYCDGCRMFLCRICAEVRPGGRVCAQCKKPCREPSPEEFQQLLAQRKAEQDNLKQAKVSEVRQKEQAEQAKLEREAKLKAEFAARKAALKQSGANPIINPVPNVGSAANIAAPSNSAPTIASSMQRPMMASEPLVTFGEHAHVKVIGRAKRYMMIIGILTILTTAAGFLFVMTWEDAVDSTVASGDTTPMGGPNLDEIRKEIRKAAGHEMTQAEIKVHEERAEAKRLEREALSVQLHIQTRKIKSTLAGYMLVGFTMIVLYFMCESYPREATMAAFFLYASGMAVNIYLHLNVYKEASYIDILCMAGAMYVLYNGMVAGQLLHQMRIDERNAAKAIV